MQPSSLDLPPSVSSPAWFPALLVRHAVVLPIFTALVILAQEGSDAIWRSFNEQLETFQVGSLPFYALWLLPLTLGVSVPPRPFRVPFGLPRRSTDLVGVGVWVVAVGITAWLYIGSVVAVLQRGPRFDVAPLVFISGAVLAPFAEEWIFRGVLWKWLGGEGFGRAGVLVTLGMTSLAFGLWHLPFSPSPVWAHALFGVLMGLLRWRTGSVLAGTLLHACANAVALCAR